MAEGRDPKCSLPRGVLLAIGRHARLYPVRLRFTTVALCWFLGTPGASARSKPARCADEHIDVIGDLDARWLKPLAQACAALAILPDRDQTALVRIYPVGGDLILQVRLQDGRSTRRVVRTPESLSVTLEALLSVPQRGPAPNKYHSPVAMTAFAGADPPDRRNAVDDAQRPRGARLLDVEVLASAGPRLTYPGRQISVTGSIGAQIELRSWFLGMGMRGDIMVAHGGAAPPGFEMETLALALTLARRFPFSAGDIDWGISPRVVLDNQGAELPAGEVNANSTDVRLAVFARFLWGHRTLRFVTETELEVSPSHMRRDIRSDPMFPRLPVWTASFGVGVSWAEP